MMTLIKLQGSGTRLWQAGFGRPQVKPRNCYHSMAAIKGLATRIRCVLLYSPNIRNGSWCLVELCVDRQTTYPCRRTRHPAIVVPQKINRQVTQWRAKRGEILSASGEAGNKVSVIHNPPALLSILSYPSLDDSMQTKMSCAGAGTHSVT
jgi:hypothetical protein